MNCAALGCNHPDGPLPGRAFCAVHDRLIRDFNHWVEGPAFDAAAGRLARFEAARAWQRARNEDEEAVISLLISDPGLTWREIRDALGFEHDQLWNIIYGTPPETVRFVNDGNRPARWSVIPAVEHRH